MPSSRRGLVVGLLMLVTAIAFEAQAVGTAMPAAASDLHGLDLYAWAFTAFAIPQIVAIVLAGRLCDRIGPTLPAMAGLALFGVGVTVAALAPTMPVLLAGRFVQGLGGGFVNVALMVLVGKLFEPAEQAAMMTWFSAAWMLPSFVGPGAAGWLTQTFSWHAVFWGILPIVVLGALMLFPPLLRADLRVQPSADAAPASVWGAVAVAAGLAVVQAAGQNLTPLSGGLMALGLVLVVVAAPRLMPVGYRPLASGLPAVVNVRLLTGGSFFAQQSFLPLMLVTLRGLTLVEAGAVITISSVGWMAGSWLQSRPWLRWRRDTIVLAGAASVAAGIGVIAVGTWWPSVWLWVVVAGATLAGVGMGLQSASTSVAVMLLSAPEQLGRNTSALQVGEAMGRSLLGGLAGTLYAFARGRGEELAAFGVPVTVLTAIAATSVAFSRRIGPVRNHAAS